MSDTDTVIRDTDTPKSWKMLIMLLSKIQICHKKEKKLLDEVLYFLK